MKANSKKVENIDKNSNNNTKIKSLDSEESQFREDRNQTNQRLIGNVKQTRYSENLKKVSQVYTAGSKPKQEQRPVFERESQLKRNETELKKIISRVPQMSHLNVDSSIKSITQISIMKLNNELMTGTISDFNDTTSLHEKFIPIQPVEFRVEPKRNTDSSNLKSQSKQMRNKKEKHNTVTEQSSVNKDKLKDLYDKIRSPEKSKFIPELQIKHQSIRNSNQTQDSPQKSLKSSLRPKVQNLNEYLSRITGKTQKKIQQEKSNENMTPQEILSGKFSIVWIFALKNVTLQISQRINQMYNPLVDEDRAVPLVANPKKIRDFINIPNCYFKIVFDIQSAEVALGFRIYSTVLEFYIFNQKGNDTLLQALDYKKVTKKVKGIFTQWDRILNRAEDEIQEEISIYKVNSGFQKRQRQRKFPNFLTLTNTDKTEATLYRINLYGAIKLLTEEKKQRYDDFMRLVLSKYESKQSEQQHIQDYIKIDHYKPITTLTQARLIIQFYVRQSFYYQVLNSMLRTMKTSEEFKPCILPFNETYHSVKLYYQNFMKQLDYQIPEMTLFRGCKISKKDFSRLKEGVFVEMFGFMSTSKSEDRAKDFVDRDGYIFVIHVKKRKCDPQKFKNFDHGFIDINRFGLASSQFMKQEQVLFNALNVYKVWEIQEKDDYTYIHLDYGVIFDLLQKTKETLTQDEYDTLVNYHYCTKVLGKIQDQGDVFLFANDLMEAKQYYDKKIKQGANLAHNYYKLANVQKQCGQIDEAEKNANQALKLYGQQLDKNDREKCMKVFSIHTKNAQINLEKQDYLTADEQIDRALQMLSDEQPFQKGIKLRERGQIKFKKGQVKNAERDFEESQYIFENLKDQGKVRRMTAYRNYYLSHLSLLCNQKTRNDLRNDLSDELNKVNQMQQKISRVNEDIEEELVKINKSLKDVSLYVEDRDKYEIYIKKAQGYFFSLKARKTNDPELKAKLLSMQAMISDYQQLAESERLMYEAISLIEQKNPFDIKVADYSKILAKMQKKQLEKFTNPGKQLINSKPDHLIQYDRVKRAQIYERCKLNFTKTLSVLLYHAKDKASPQILDIRNQLGELTFGQNDYAQCEKIIKQARQGNEKVIHSQMSKTLMIMAKISYARGQLRNAFQTLNQSHKVLEESMVLKHQKQNQTDNSKLQKYRKIFQNSDALLLIKFMRVNIYHKQKNHDLALKGIHQIQTVIERKVGTHDSHPMMADLLQARGTLQVFTGEIQGFDKYFQRAIELRTKQFGYYHPMNAKTCCAYAKFLIMVKDEQKAKQLLEKAVDIISAFEETNPHYWAVFYAQGFYNENNYQYVKSEAFYQKSLDYTQQNFDKTHIAIKQVMLRLASSLNRSGKISESIKLYQQLQEQLDEGIRESSVRFSIDCEQDDEKVSLKKLMYTQLSEIEVEQSKSNESILQSTMNNLVNTGLYKSKLSLLRNTYNISNRDVFQK